MTNEDLELVDLNNQQFKELLLIQGKAYKKVLNSYRAYTNDLEKIKRINLNIALTDAAILTELENIKKLAKYIYNQILQVKFDYKYIYPIS